MTHFAIYDLTGRILRTGCAPDAMIPLQARPNEYWTITDAAIRDTTHYVSDLIEGTLLEKPPQPSERHQFDYATGQWVEVIDLDAEKAKQTEAINAACRAAIIGGFESSALGTPLLYDSELEDQLNLTDQRQAAQMTGEPQPYKCLDPVVGSKAFVMHTGAQLDQVFLDGKTFKEAQLIKATVLKTAIAQASTLDELLAITWETP